MVLEEALQSFLGAEVLFLVNKGVVKMGLELYGNKLAISGKLASGKTTIAEQFDGTIVAIGNSIKKTASLLIEDTHLLNTYLHSVIGPSTKDIFPMLEEHFQKNFLNGIWAKEPKSGFYVKNQSYRDLLQDVGDIVRGHLGRDIWCRMTLQEALNLLEHGHSVICDDIRLKEEKRLFEDAGFPVIRLEVSQSVQRERSLKKYGEVNEELFYHKTETDLDHAHFPLTLDTSFDSVKQTSLKVSKFLTGVAS